MPLWVVMKSYKEVGINNDVVPRDRFSISCHLLAVIINPSSPSLIAECQIGRDVIRPIGYERLLYGVRERFVAKYPIRRSMLLGMIGGLVAIAVL